MAANTFQCSIVTPEKAVLETGDATFVSLPAHDGEIGILPGRAPLLCQLGIGSLRVEAEGKTEVFFVDRGFAQMVDNKLSILTEQARRPSEIDRQQAVDALAAAEAMEIRGAEDLWSDERLVSIRRARAQIAVLDKHGS